MIHTIKNEYLSVSVDSLGAQLKNIQKNNVEYLWQGDPTYWKDQAPVLFPICGRLFGGKYTYLSKDYEMNIHGFARHSEFEVKLINKDSITMQLTSNDAIKSQYPFEFVLSITYSLLNSTLVCSHTVTNLSSDTTLPYSIGGHPGFNVPVSDRGDFEDYSIYFGLDKLSQVMLSHTCFILNRYEDYPLSRGEIPLRHDMFDNDALFFKNNFDQVTLRRGEENILTLKCSDMTHLGLWHKVGADAPYVCIEPWAGLPSQDGKVDDFEDKVDMIMLPPNTSQDFNYDITIH